MTLKTSKANMKKLRTKKKVSILLKIKMKISKLKVLLRNSFQPYKNYVRKWMPSSEVKY
jgi:hypothetical protein